jgi:hypothetical protein
VSNRDDFLRVVRGEKPLRVPCVHYGFWDEKAMHKLAPADTWDENTMMFPQDDPPCDGYSAGPRTPESRGRAIRMARHLDAATIGVGKGAVIDFGHGGPGEIQPRVIERTAEHKVLLYEGGHKRTIHFNPHSVRYHDFPVRSEADLDRLELPDMRDPVRFSDVAEDARTFKAAGFVPTGAVQGFFAGIHNSFMDFPDALGNLLAEPVLMRKLTERLARMSLDAVRSYLDRGVEVITICDDLGNAGGLLISPELFRSFFLPWYEDLVRIVHENGCFLHMHSHGNIAAVLPDLAGAGIDIINPFDTAENPNLQDLVRKFGDRIVFCGGSVPDLSLFDLEEVARISRDACSLARVAERGYMFMGNPGMEHLSVETWEAWRAIFAREREEALLP